MKRLLILPTLLAMILSSAVMAQPKDDFRGKARERLNLTTEQESAIREIRAKTQKDMIDLRSAIQKKRIDLGQLTDAESPDRGQVEKALADISSMQLKQKLLLFDTEQSIVKQLTADQKKIWKELKQERRGRMQEGLRERFRGRGHR